MGSQFDTLQIFAMKETNISEKDHKEWAELDFIMIHSSRKCEQKTTRFSNVIFHRICPFWNWEVNEVRNNEHRIRNLKNKLSFKVLQCIRIYSLKNSFEKASWIVVTSSCMCLEIWSMYHSWLCRSTIC